MHHVPLSRRVTLAVAATAIAAVPCAAVVSAGQAAESSSVPTYTATITRTEHDIPHIVANDWGSLGFGSGYAAAETTICTLADTVLTARGQRSKYLGPTARYDDQVSMSGTNLQVDALMTDIHDRHVVEDLLADPKAGPGTQAREMVAGFAEGVNQYLRDIGGADHITDPRCKGAAYITPTATALDLWYGVYTANLLASTGHFLQEIVGATPPSTSDPGLPLDIGDAVFSAVPDIPLDITKLLTNLLPIGSNATAVGKDATSTGSGMILGNPHFPWRGRYRFTQQHLTIPGEYDVAGGSLVGSPVVNIGWNNNVAWSHTVSTAYRFTPYEYKTVLAPTKYLYGGALKDLDHRVVHVEAKKSDGSIETLTEDLYRTPEGYVVDAPSQFMGWTPLSFFAIRDANGEQLRTIDTFLNMGKATSVRDLLAKQDAGGGMPWVNTIAADRAGDVLYADHSVVPNVSNDLANQCMTPIGHVLFLAAGLPGLDGTRANGACKWGTDSDAERPGIFGPSNLPDTVRTDWVMNANDSYWLPNPAQKLEGFARIIGCEKCQRTMRTRMVDHYVIDRLKTAKVTPESLRGTEHENRVWAAEAMGTNADLVTICEAAEGSHTDACDALAHWDRHSNKDSTGYALFEAFATRLPTSALPISVGPNPNWKVQFDADDPVETPRDIDESNKGIVDAMKAAIASLREKHIAMDASWGSVQVAGDDGAPPIPLGGGEGDNAGNANALASRNADQNTNFGKPITYGSSHIQAISFLPNGQVDTKTILTYGQSENSSRASHADQTQLFSDKQWVSFPWTTAQIADQKVSTKTVTNGTSSPATGSCSGKNATKVGTSGNDVIEGTSGADVIYAGDGNDTVRGNGGNDVICGGPGADHLYGGGGNDTIDGADGADGLLGDSGDDVLIGGPGADAMVGGTGVDRVSYAGYTASVTVTIGDGKTNDGNSTDGPANARDDVRKTVEIVVGGKAGDKLTGDGYANQLFGGDGNDTLLGQAADDRLYGGNGDDGLYGQAGNDYLRGETGQDKFYGEAGDDYLQAKDQTRDQVLSGGAGSDSASVDKGLDPPLK